MGICLTHGDSLYRCPRCGAALTFQPTDHPERIPFMVQNLMLALRRRRKVNDSKAYTAKATEFAGWLEVTNG